MTAFELAQRYTGLKETPGLASNKEIMKMLRLDMQWPENDEVPWCSAFVNFVAWQLRLPRSYSLAARSWLKTGTVISIEDAEPRNDVVILTRGKSPQPGPEVIHAPGHVGFFAGKDANYVYLLGGNQNDSVNISAYPLKRVLGIRRLA